MKKIKLIIGMALVCALVFTCFAFAACGDSSVFDKIDMSKQATSDDYKAFSEKALAANSELDETTGLPKFLLEQSLEVNLDMTLVSETTFAGATIKSDTSLNMSGFVNMAVKPTAKINAELKVSASSAGEKAESTVKMEVTVLSDFIYMLSSTDGKTTKTKMEMSSIGDIIGGVMSAENAVYASDTATDETALSIEEFLGTIKEVFAGMGLEYTPELYIQDNLAKVKLDADSYIGVEFTSDWKLASVGVVIKGVDSSKVDGVSAMGLGGTMDLSCTVKAVSRKDVTAPSDAGEYKTGVPDFGGLA